MARPKKLTAVPDLTPDFEPLLTDHDLADLLKVPLSWVQDAAKAERIPCTYIGKHRRYTREHYRRIVAGGERPARNAA